MLRIAKIHAYSRVITELTLSNILIQLNRKLRGTLLYVNKVHTATCACTAQHNHLTCYSFLSWQNCRLFHISSALLNKLVWNMARFPEVFSNHYRIVCVRIRRRFTRCFDLDTSFCISVLGYNFAAKAKRCAVPAAACNLSQFYYICHVCLSSFKARLMFNYYL